MKMLRLPALAFGFAAVAFGAQAAVITDTLTPFGTIDGFAKTVTYNDDVVAAGRGTTDNRSLGVNALGATDGTFFEIGLNDTVDFTFGAPFVGPGSVVEVTFGTRANFLEKAIFQVGVGGAFTNVNPTPISNQTAGPIQFTFAGGPFDTLRVLNHSDSVQQDCTFNSQSYKCGGFDIDSVRVNPIPLPASALLLFSALAGLGGLSLSRRRTAAAA